MPIPAHRRLYGLPEVFTTNTLAASLGGDKGAASVYLARWRREGLIASLGPRAGVHFNLLRDPAAASTRFNDAIVHVFPGAVIGGVSAVHAAGWTTQVPHRLEVMVPRRRSLPTLYDVAAACRPQDWFVEARRHVARPGVLPMLRPDFALADLVATGEWCPDPDDLEWDMIDVARLRRVFSERGVDLPAYWAADMAAVEAMGAEDHGALAP